MEDKEQQPLAPQEFLKSIASPDRLDSWKEIAAHLKRDIRTVRRWEKNEGLPIHRHMHQKLPTVYAFKTELDAWMERRRPKPDKHQEDLQPEQAVKPDGGYWPRISRRTGWAAALLVAALLAVGGLRIWLSQNSVRALDGPIWVLITSFDNRTGETIFDGTLEYALERELANSQFVNVVPRERVLDTLELMKKPPNTIIESDVGREICLRDGGIQALITGRVEKLDSYYVLSAVLINSANGVTVASFSEEAASQPALAGAIRGLSRRVRTAFGEALNSIELSLQKLEKVSTPSLRALQLYSQADALIREHKNGQAVPLLQQAIHEDSDFASAHVLLAHSLSNLGRHPEAVPYYQRAMELAHTTTDRERYFIRASHYQRNERDQHKAIENLELLLRLYPDHYWAASNLSHAYYLIGQPRRALPAILRRADLRPTYFDHQLRAAQALVVWGDSQQAETYLQRAREIVSEGGVSPWRVASLRLFPAHQHWVRGELELALQEVSKVANEISANEESALPALRFQAGSMFLVLGKIEAATEMLLARDMRGEETALLAFAMGDTKTTFKHLNGITPSYRGAILMNRIGQLARAEAMLSSPEAVNSVFAPFIPNVWSTLARGELAFARGNMTEGIPLLEEASQMLRPWPTSFYFMCTEALANSLERQGNPKKSLEIVEQASQYKLETIFWGPATYFWMRNELQRAGLYKKLGQSVEAEAVETGLLKLLSLAGPAHPLLREFRGMRSGQSVSSNATSF